MVKPFSWDFYDGAVHTTYWNHFDESLCIPKLIEFLKGLDTPHVIYAHNGGKFDFYFLLKYLEPDDVLIINGRIVTARLGKHELRDSYAAVPVALRAYKKDDIDYRLLEEKVRHNHADEILKYLRSDTEYLFKLMSEYRLEFGAKLTMASAAMGELKKFHTFERTSEHTDKTYREFFFGGRVECFQKGLLPGDWKVYDVNSMYPSVMRDFLHPISDACVVTSKLGPHACFVDVSGYSKGAFPVRGKTLLSFPHTRGRFKTTIHEYKTAIELGLFRTEKIHAVHHSLKRANFGEFVNHFYAARQEAKAKEREEHTLFYKLVMNSAYGKFAQNPDGFKEFVFLPYGRLPDLSEGWTIAENNPIEEWRLWSRPSVAMAGKSYWNILTAASITGAARSVLMRAIHSAKNPIYCDTDSLICENLTGVHIDENELGAWKLEKEGTYAAIAGKKMYALYTIEKPTQKKLETDNQYETRIKFLRGRKNEWANKIASKGVRISGGEMLRVAAGEVVPYENPVPAFKLSGAQKFYKPRKVRIT